MGQEDQEEVAAKLQNYRIPLSRAGELGSYFSTRVSGKENWKQSLHQAIDSFQKQKPNHRSPMKTQKKKKKKKTNLAEVNLGTTTGRAAYLKTPTAQKLGLTEPQLAQVWQDHSPGLTHQNTPRSTTSIRTPVPIRYQDLELPLSPRENGGSGISPLGLKLGTQKTQSQLQYLQGTPTPSQVSQSLAGLENLQHTQGTGGQGAWNLENWIGALKQNLPGSKGLVTGTQGTQGTGINTTAPTGVPRGTKPLGSPLPKAVILTGNGIGRGVGTGVDYSFSQPAAYIRKQNKQGPLGESLGIQGIPGMQNPQGNGWTPPGFPGGNASQYQSGRGIPGGEPTAAPVQGRKIDADAYFSGQGVKYQDPSSGPAVPGKNPQDPMERYNQNYEQDKRSLSPGRALAKSTGEGAGGGGGGGGNENMIEQVSDELAEEIKRQIAGEGL